MSRSSSKQSCALRSILGAPMCRTDSELDQGIPGVVSQRLVWADSSTSGPTPCSSVSQWYPRPLLIAPCVSSRSFRIQLNPFAGRRTSNSVRFARLVLISSAVCDGRLTLGAFGNAQNESRQCCKLSLPQSGIGRQIGGDCSIGVHDHVSE